MSESKNDRGAGSPSRAELARRLAALERENAHLRDRVATLEDQVGPGLSTLPAAASDYRDARVLEALEAGETVHLTRLQALYEERTDIRNRKTLRDRVKTLVETDAFDEVDYQLWRYGPANDESQRDAT